MARQQKKGARRRRPSRNGAGAEKAVGPAVEAERALRVYSALVDSSQDAIITTATDGTIETWNRAAERIYGYSAPEAIGRPITIIAPPEHLAEFKRNLRVLEQGRAIGPYESQRRRGDGGAISVSVTLSPIRDSGGAVVGASGIVRDITEHRRTQAALAESERRLRTVLDRMRLIGVVIDAAGRITYCNDYLAEVSGWSREELIGSDYLARFIPPGHPAIGVFHEAMATGDASAHYRNQILTRDGRRREIEWNNTVLRDSAGRLTGIVSIGEDVTDRSRVEEELRRSEANYRGLVEYATLGIYRSTPDGRFLTVNPALIKMLGYGWAEELLRLDMARDVYADPGQRAELLAAFGERDEASKEMEWKRKDGSRISVRVSVRTVRTPGGQIECYEGLVEDVTQQRSLEAQFRQAQRLEAVGRLAGGVAHDFNNILTAITGYSDLLLEELGPGDPKRTDIEEIRSAARRAAALTRQLLAFSRKQVFQTRVLDLNDVVQTLDKMLRRLIGEDVKLALALAAPLGAVRADPGQIEQVILNLAVNSRDAMPGGGRLTLETADVDLDEGFARSTPGWCRAGT